MSKEKQIEEMAKDFYSLIPDDDVNERDCRFAAEVMFAKGYRQQSEGHWFISEYEYLTCSECGHYHWTGCDSNAEAKERLEAGDCPNFCPNCGAKMKGF